MQIGFLWFAYSKQPLLELTVLHVQWYGAHSLTCAMIRTYKLYIRKFCMHNLKCEVIIFKKGDSNYNVSLPEADVEPY